MMFCFRNILQIWIIWIGFRDMNNFVTLSICRHEFKYTCLGYCEFFLFVFVFKSIIFPGSQNCKKPQDKGTNWHISYTVDPHH